MIQESMLLLSSLSLGIFLGAQVTEALLFVPNWKSLGADDFFDFYKNYGKKIHHFFAPLTIAATVLPLITVVYSFIHQTKYQVLFGLMGLFTLAFFLTYFLYFKEANQRFFDGSLPNEKLPKELKKWGNWHWIRVCFEFIAFGLSLFLLMKI
ncbi:DUF1772 domain-containing protein [Aureispira anguillae]|uniref:DUF1772 domain-containing protein n=1 Tax=Aureispira anguillae TaxID=2864201 RepID=A0A915YE76_9BACT|nr:DUF1772 domain-containing protein [Aureispira anguillae]BDS11473.1 DUF1772 domain-containing protein [Aureispira anguillae]